MRLSSKQKSEKRRKISPLFYLSVKMNKMSFRIIFIALSLGLGLAVFLPYYLGIFKKTARPHFFSWFTWGILTALGFVLSSGEGGGEGSWIFALQSILCLGVAVYALFRGEKNITRTDWIFFISAIAAMSVYLFIKIPVAAIILTALTDFLAFLPTFRKSFKKPYEEPVLAYIFAFFSFLFSLGALENYSFVTMFYLLTLVLTNSAFVIFVLIRRKTVAETLIKNAAEKLAGF